MRKIIYRDDDDDACLDPSNAVEFVTGAAIAIGVAALTVAMTAAFAIARFVTSLFH